MLVGPILSHVSVPVTTDLPSGYQRIDWPGRLGSIAAVANAPERPVGAALLVHGFTGAKEDFFALLGPLQSRGWAVAAIDLPGMAESDGPPEESHYQVDLLAADIAALIQHWTGRHGTSHVVAHSMGGVLTREALLRSTAGVASLTLYSSGPGPVSPSSQDDARLLQQLLDHVSPGQVQLLKEQRDAQLDIPSPSEQIVAALRQRWAETSPGHLRALSALALDPPDRRQELAEALRRADIPAMLVWGEHDDVWSGEAFRELAGDLLATTVVLPGLGHSAAVEDPMAMVAALDAFWRIDR